MRYAYVLCGDAHLAQDLVQQALSGAYPRWPQISTGRPEAYVRRSVTNAFIDETRRPGVAKPTIQYLTGPIQPITSGVSTTATPSSWR
ncbi:sigma factor [Janibacter melonis]|uniref:sigma factor n=1 Tax=Janibacter melonis TaxID=262209 RepID=UPI0020959AFE|nr:sigma factor [Janibacter melonis]